MNLESDGFAWVHGAFDPDAVEAMIERLRVYPETQAAFCRGLRMYRNSAWCLFGFGDRRLSIR